MRLIILLTIQLAFCSCSQVQENKRYPNQVGDITFEEGIDDPDFKICNPRQVFQYYNFSNGLQYRGEKVKINEHFQNGFKGRNQSGESGFITVRFIVNCEGETGWFRVQGMDADFKERKFAVSLVDEILALTRKLDGWIAAGERVDYYQYLTFKFENGMLLEIMP
jgi:hypothetical protein